MNIIPFTLRDFIIYVVPGIFFLINITLMVSYTGLFPILDFFDFLSKNSYFMTIIIIPFGYIVGIILSNKKATEPLTRFIKPLCVKNFYEKHSNITENNLIEAIKTYTTNQEKCPEMSKIMLTFQKNKKFKIESNNIWYMMRVIEHENTTLTNNLERINSLRVLIHQLLTSLIILSILSTIAFMFACARELIIYLINKQANFKFFYAITHSILMHIMLCLIAKKSPETNKWFVRCVLMSYDVVIKQKEYKNKAD